jgi:hypothetical protein
MVPPFLIVDFAFSAASVTDRLRALSTHDSEY